MGQTVISVMLAFTMALVSLQQVVAQKTNETSLNVNVPSVIMINQMAIIEVTDALKNVLKNITQKEEQQQCEMREVLDSMHASLERSEVHQSELLNTSIDAWSALSEVPSTLQVIAKAADAYKPDDCKETKKLIIRMDKLINVVKKTSDTTVQAIQALQDNTMMMVEALKQSIELHNETFGRMKNEIDSAKKCSTSMEDQMGNLVQVVTDIRKEMQGCHEGSPCPMMGNNNNGVLRRCDNHRDRRQTSTSCNLCCEPSIGPSKPGYLDLSVQTETPDVVIVHPVSDPPRTVNCCPSGFTIVGKECFYISGMLSNWFDARRSCQAMGGYIAKPRDNVTLAQYIMKNYENKRWYWIERSDLDAVPQAAEDSVSVAEHNCHVFDAGQENNKMLLAPSACSGPWYFICQHEVLDECASMRNP